MSQTLPRRRRRAIAVGAALAVIALPASVALATGQLSTNGGAAYRLKDNTENVRDAIKDGEARNVILIIGDGMSSSEVTMARNYEYGAGGRLPGIDSLPLSGQATTYSVYEDGTPDYDPESASTGSAWSTGTKTYDGAISVDIEGNPQRTILELAKAKGLKGNVSTAEIQDASPAAAMSHVTSRRCYGPVATTATCPTNALENGGLGSITEQLLAGRPDVVLGGGARTFGEVATAGAYEGKTLRQQADERGFAMVGTKAELDAITAANQEQPVIGTFAEGNMPVRFQGPEATAAGGTLAAQQCTSNADWNQDLSLGKLTGKAIDLLNADNDKGFFLQVEGASIDKQAHGSNACGQIGETLDLDEAVQAAMDFAKEDGNTTVLVSADHSHTPQIVEAGSVTSGGTVNLRTNEGSDMTISYATSPVGESQQHTGAQVPVLGYGPQAANVVGTIDQTDLFFISTRALGLERDPAELSREASVTAEPRRTEPGQDVTIKLDGFKGDFTATVTLTQGNETVDLGKVNLETGAASLTTEVPDARGAHQVKVVGDQSGVEATETIVVKPQRPGKR